MKKVLLVVVLVFGATAAHAQPNLVGLWHFDEGLGTFAGDSSGQDNHGTVEGAIWVPGASGAFALRFDGSDRVQVGDRANLEPDTVTLAACVRHDAGPPDYAYIASEGAQGCICTSYALYVGSGTSTHFYTCNGSNFSLSAGVPAYDLWDGEWHHLAGTYDGSSVRLYLDGAPVGSPVAAVAPNYSLSTHSEFLIGHDLPTCSNLGGFVGDIDEVTVWDAALSQSEIEALADCTDPLPVSVSIDIKPGSYPNCFNVNGHGVIPVAILGSADFDVNEIDTYSLAFDGMTVRVRGNRGPLCSTEDSNGDGLVDLVCHFEDDSEYWTGGEDVGVVTGVLLDGSEFEGSDSICIVP